MDELVEVDLVATEIGNDSLKHLPEAKRLRWLAAADTEVRPHGLAACPGGKVKLHVAGMTAELRDAASGNALAPPLRHLAPNEDGAKIVCWAFSPDGKLLATATGYKNGHIAPGLPGARPPQQAESNSSNPHQARRSRDDTR